MDVSLFSQLSEVNSRMLKDPFSLENIKVVFLNCEGSKSPGPYGLNFDFIHKFWSLLEGYFIKFMYEFHLFVKLRKSITGVSVLLGVFIKYCPNLVSCLNFHS